MWSTYFHTLRHLRPGQILGRVVHRLHRPRPDARPAPPVRALRRPWVVACGRAASLLGPDEACFLNQRRTLAFPQAWNDATVPKLWLYNLHYFEGLLAPADEAQRTLHRAWVQRWIDQNPPGHGNGWEPYPLSLRIVSWIKWMLAGEPADPVVLQSLAVQVRYLRQRLETHLLGNHLFENAKALVFAGHFFDGEEAESWRRKGEAILAEQLQEQLLPDGGHFERSPMYHALLLEGLLDLHNLHVAFAADSATPWRKPVVRMLDWLPRLCHPDGGLAFFNDAAFGIASDWSDLRTYAERLGLTPTPVPPSMVWLGESGYARLQSGSMLVLADVAPVGPDYLPGHAHADSLSFECSVGTQRLFVNSGTSTYEIGRLRQWQRGTSAHNTLAIDGADSSEVWAGFRVARRARVRLVERPESDKPCLTASHDGYRRLRGSPVHQRRWCLSEGRLELHDRVDGHGDHRVECFFHLHPEVQAGAIEGHVLSLSGSDGRGLARLTLDASFEWAVRDGHWYPGFGIQTRNQHVYGWRRGPLPMHCTVTVDAGG
ncbi:alginate lyase family protein [uncultured Hydrogenophaga sp.]|uniref:heparinase II/III family protein n=1 Tax=uncultured Hydrogenophaga sp. TaxID=199683 RepID=UPI00258A7901|nr:alginate lyase family protein [uncultured Hydrogenophaga sp.]